MTATHGRRPVRGFSILELIIVVAITLTVAAIAIPRVVTTTQNFKLRSTASGLSGLIQKCRMLSVARNAFYPVKYVTSGGVNYVYIDINGDGIINPAENTNILVPPNITFDTTGGGFSLSSMSLSYTTVIGLPVFNPRGLPCIVQSGGACTVTGQGYIYYLRQDRSVGATGWAAVTVSPAGRAQVFTWDGSQWE